MPGTNAAEVQVAGCGCHRSHPDPGRPATRSRAAMSERERGVTEATSTSAPSPPTWEPNLCSSSMPVDRRDDKIRYRAVRLAAGGKAEIWLSRRAQIEVHTNYSLGGTEDRGGSGRGYWDACSEKGCLGEAIKPAGACYLHSSTEEQERHYDDARQGRRSLTIQGVEVTPELWRRLAGQPGKLERVRLAATAAVFPFKVQLAGRRLSSITLHGATFYDGLELEDCQFLEILDLSFADFSNSPVGFVIATLQPWR